MKVTSRGDLGKASLGKPFCGRQRASDLRCGAELGSLRSGELRCAGCSEAVGACISPLAWAEVPFVYLSCENPLGRGAGDSALAGRPAHLAGVFAGVPARARSGLIGAAGPPGGWILAPFFRQNEPKLGSLQRSWGPLQPAGSSPAHSEVSPKQFGDGRGGRPGGCGPGARAGFFPGRGSAAKGLLTRPWPGLPAAPAPSRPPPACLEKLSGVRRSQSGASPSSALPNGRGRPAELSLSGEA